jgi:hypothetical protein
MSDTSSDPQAALKARIFDGLFQVVAEHGWRGTTLTRIAAAAGVSLGEMRGFASCPEGIMLRYSALVDRQVLDGTVPTEGESPRDRIFDVLMRRLDAMQPHRAGIVRFMKDLPFHPFLVLSLGAAMERSMGWMLEAAGLDSHGPAGLARIKGLTAVWVFTLRAWLKDDSADLAPTMAALDRALDRADQVARSLDPAARRKPAAEPEPDVTTD